MNRDPIGENGGINLYGFIGNQPNGSIDPLGLFEWKDLNPLRLFDPSFWGGLLYGAAGGGGNTGWDPNSNIALRASEGIGIGDFEDANGNRISGGELAADVVGIAVAGSLSAVVDGLGRMPKGERCLTPYAKRRLAKELGDIPRSAQPTAQGVINNSRSPGRGGPTRWWEYKDSNGTTKIVIEHGDGSVHIGTPKLGSPHRDGGLPKYYPVPGTGHVGD